MRASERAKREFGKRRVMLTRTNGDGIVEIDAGQMTSEEVKEWVSGVERITLERIVYEAIMAARRR